MFDLYVLHSHLLETRQTPTPTFLPLCPLQLTINNKLSWNGQVENLLIPAQHQSEHLPLHQKVRFVHIVIIC
jgi:hypothetical protein